MYRVYSGPIPPADVFDSAIAKGLTGVLFFGEDFAGTHEAYQVSKLGLHFGGWILLSRASSLTKRKPSPGSL